MNARILKKLWNTEFLTFLSLVIACIGIIIGLYNTNAKNNVSGSIVIRPFWGTSFVPSAQFEPALSKGFNLEYKGKYINPKKIELLSFTLTNNSGKIITPKDFYSPITMLTKNSEFLTVNIIRPASRPGLHLIPINNHKVEIEPTLLNPGDSFGVTVLLLRKTNAPIFQEPSNNTVSWRALIKGINLKVATDSSQENNDFLNRLGLNVYIFHTGYAVIALFLLGTAMSMAQVLRFLISKSSYKSNVYKSLEISIRVAISWAAAESIVSIYDMPNLAPVGYVSILLYIVIFLFPSGPRIIQALWRDSI